jgi:hypothetical protein
MREGVCGRRVRRGGGWGGRRGSRIGVDLHGARSVLLFSLKWTDLDLIARRTQLFQGLDLGRPNHAAAVIRVGVG